MGQIRTDAAAVFRDYKTAGVPASGEYDPEKALIRALFGTVEDQTLLATSTAATAIESLSLAAPPVSPNLGQRWIIAAPASGVWTGKENQIATYNGAGWDFLAPSAVYVAIVKDALSLFAWNGAQWVDVTAQAVVFDTLAALNAANVHAPVNGAAFVVSDPVSTNNGIYRNTGTPAVPVWVRVSAIKGDKGDAGAAWSYLPAAGGAVKAANAAALPSFAYASGVMTASANGAFPSIDGVALSVGDRFWHWDYTGANGANLAFGIYTLTNAGSAGTKWTATRATDADSAGELGLVSAFVQQGTANGGLVLAITQAAGAITLGTTALIVTVASGNPALTAEAATRAAADSAETAARIAGDADAMAAAQQNGTLAPFAELLAGINNPAAQSATFSARGSLVSTFAGWQSSVNFPAGGQVNAALIYIDPETAPGSVTCFIAAPSASTPATTPPTVVATKTINVRRYGWQLVTFDAYVTSASFASGVAYVGYYAASGRVARPSFAPTMNRPNQVTWPEFYTTTGALGTWTAVAASQGTYSVVAQLIDTATMEAALEAKLTGNGGPQPIDIVNYSAKSIVAAGAGSATLVSLGSPFAGYGQLYAPWVGMSFNAVQIPVFMATLQDTVAHTPTAVRVEVRKGSPTGALVASGQVNINRAVTQVGNVLVPLSATVDNTAVASANFCVSYVAVNALGSVAICGNAQGAVANQTTGSYYYDAVQGLWAAYSGNPAMLIELVSLTSPSVSSIWGEPRAPRLLNAAPAAVELPSVMYAVMGSELNVYLDNVTRFDSRLFETTAICSSSTVGISYSECFRLPASGAYAPAGVGSITLNVAVEDPWHGDVIGKSAMTINIVAANARAGQSETVLVIGDSLVASNSITAQILANAAADTGGLAITLIGTQGSGSNKHEGRSGQTAAWFYTNASSPFVFSGAFNFASYLSTNGFSAPTRVVFMLGTNDGFAAAQANTGGAVGAQMGLIYEAMIAQMAAAGVSKFTICAPPVPTRQQDGFGASYGGLYVRSRHKRGMIDLARQLRLRFEGRTGAGITYCAPWLNLDTANNMQVASAVAVNARNAATIARQNNGVHPASSGYSQGGDGVWQHIKGT